MFSALPAFANPFLDQGIIPGQQTWNRKRNIYDAELVLLPDKIVSPLFGYTQNHYAGPGTTTALVGGNVYQLNETLRVVDQEPRVGLLFNAYGISGHFIQGWRKTVENDVQTLMPGKGAGDYPESGARPDAQSDELLELRPTRRSTSRSRTRRSRRSSAPAAA